MSALQGKRGLMEGLSSRGRVGARRTLHVSRALTKERKHEVVTKLKSELETSTAVVGFSFKGVSVSDMEKLRGDIPDDASLVVAKNTLMKKAAGEVDGWSEVGQFCTGSNAFLFLREDLKTGFKVRRSAERSGTGAEDAEFRPPHTHKQTHTHIPVENFFFFLTLSCSSFPFLSRSLSLSFAHTHTHLPFPASSWHPGCKGLAEDVREGRLPRGAERRMLRRRLSLDR